jgi:hypothetical protein
VIRNSGLVCVEIPLGAPASLACAGNARQRRDTPGNTKNKPAQKYPLHWSHRRPPVPENAARTSVSESAYHHLAWDLVPDPISSRIAAYMAVIAITRKPAALTFGDSHALLRRPVGLSQSIGQAEAALKELRPDWHGIRNDLQEARGEQLNC